MFIRNLMLLAKPLKYHVEIPIGEVCPVLKIKQILFIVAVVLFLIALSLVAVPIGSFAAHASSDQKSSIKNGALIYSNECASCHGSDLEGENDWMSQNEDGTMRAPPHDDTGHTWHHPDEFLFKYTKLGGAQVLEQLGVKDVKSGMPAYSSRLSDQEIWDVLNFIKSNWSEKSRRYQRKRTEQANG